MEVPKNFKDLRKLDAQIIAQYSTAKEPFPTFFSTPIFTSFVLFTMFTEACGSPEKLSFALVQHPHVLRMIPYYVLPDLYTELLHSPPQCWSFLFRQELEQFSSASCPYRPRLFPQKQRYENCKPANLYSRSLQVFLQASIVFSLPCTRCGRSLGFPSLKQPTYSA